MLIMTSLYVDCSYRVRYQWFSAGMSRIVTIVSDWPHSTSLFIMVTCQSATSSLVFGVPQGSSCTWSIVVLIVFGRGVRCDRCRLVGHSIADDTQTYFSVPFDHRCASHTAASRTLHWTYRTANGQKPAQAKLATKHRSSGSERQQSAKVSAYTGTRKFDHISPVLRDLHWLPVRQWIIFKATMPVYKCLHGLALSYLAKLGFVDQCPLFQAVDSYMVRCHRRFYCPQNMDAHGSRSFLVCGPVTWKSLPEFA